MEFRRAIYAHQMKICEKMFGEIEVDESYFGAKRVRGYRGKLKRGRGTFKQPVFGLLKRDGRVYHSNYTELQERSAAGRY